MSPPEPSRRPSHVARTVGYLQDVWVERAALLRGFTFLLGGAALVLVGSLLGLNLAKAMQMLAGTIAVTGVVMMLLGFFLYVLPPLLPAK